MTDTTPTPTPTPTPVRVTKQDVLDALGETDPNRTNASAIRVILGRGGNNTIQKLLEEIRAERAAPVVTLDTAVPPAAPAALVDAVWSAAWTHAQNLTLARIDALTLERDTLKSALDVRVADHAALLLETDALRDALAETEAVRAQQIADDGVKLDEACARVKQLEAQLALSQAEAASLQQQLERAAEFARRDLEQVRRDADYAAEISRRDAEIKDAAHQRDRAHLMDQIVELKALLYRTAPATLADPAPAAPAADHDI